MAPSCSLFSAASKSARISRSRASRATCSRWRVRAQRQATEQTVCRPVRSTTWQTGQRRRDPTTGVRTLSGGTSGSGPAATTSASRVTHSSTAAAFARSSYSSSRLVRSTRSGSARLAWTPTNGRTSQPHTGNSTAPFSPTTRRWLGLSVGLMKPLLCNLSSAALVIRSASCRQGFYHASPSVPGMCRNAARIRTRARTPPGGRRGSAGAGAPPPGTGRPRGPAS